MSSLSRRQILQTIGTTSVAAAASLTMPAFGQSTKQSSTVPDPNSLYLIFNGAWAFYCEKGRLFAVTTDFPQHTYDLGISPPTGLPGRPIERGQTYSVDIGGYTSKTSFDELIKPMVAAKQGMIFKNVVRKQKPPVGMRTISLPLPLSISPAALVRGPKIKIDATQSPITDPVEWPAALALVYPVSWQNVSIHKGNMQQFAYFDSSSFPRLHLSFRTCVTARCDKPVECKIDCTKVKDDIDHANHVHNDMMGMLDFKGKMIPKVEYPRCTEGVKGQGGCWPVTADRGGDTNIQESEIGMVTDCVPFANLHNCAAGILIIGT